MRYVIAIRKSGGLEGYWRVDGDFTIFEFANDAEWAARNLLAQGVCDEWRVIDMDATDPDGNWAIVASYPS